MKRPNGELALLMSMWLESHTEKKEESKLNLSTVRKSAQAEWAVT